MIRNESRQIFSHAFLVACISEDLECLEAEDTEDREGGGEAQKYPIGPKFNYSSPVTADDVRLVSLVALNAYLFHSV